MSITAKVISQSNITAAVDGVRSPTVSAVGIQGMAGTAAVSVSQLTDVDTTDLQTGSVLVYNTNTSKWVSTVSFDSQYILSLIHI